MMTREQVLSVLERARWAPSGDNMQPWRVKLHADHLEVVLRPGAELDFMDTQATGMQITIGAFGELFRLAAIELGFAARCEIQPQSALPSLAKIFVSPQASARDPLSAHIENRCSNRKLYHRSRWTAADNEFIQQAVGACDGATVSFVTETDALHTLGKAVGRADYVRFGHEQCHVEFHSKVRWGDKEAREKRTGFDVNTFEILPYEVLALRLTRPLSVLRLIKKLTPMPKLAAHVAERQINNCGATLIFSASGSPASFGAVGISMIRAWLAATSLGGAAQVMGVFPLLWRRCFALGGEGLSASDVKALTGAAQLAGTIPGLPPVNQWAIMLRVGRAPPPSARSYRLTAEELLLA